ncbi:MAG: DNA recombination protein RmuC [Parvularculaceae bacterium]
MQTLAPPVTGQSAQAEPSQPSAGGEENAASTQTAATEAPPLITGPASALTTGAIAFFVIFFIALTLIVRGRVYGARSRRQPAEADATTSFFEPAGEDADITFEDEGAPAPERRRDARREETPKREEAPQADRWTDERDSEVTIEREETADQGDLHDLPEEKPEPKKKKSAFAGLFAKKPPEPTPTNTEELADEPFDAPADDDADMLAAVSGWDATAPRETPKPAAPIPDIAAEAMRVRQAEESTRQALKRAAEAETLARDLKRANEDAERVMNLSLRRHEEEMEAKANALSAMEKRLADLSDEFHTRTAVAPAPQALVASHDADADAVSEEHFAEFANLMGEQFDALRSSVNDAIERLSTRIDHLPPAGAAGVSAPAVLPATASRVQLADLLGDALAPQRYQLAKKLSTGRTADAVIATPAKPIAIDARFPVETFDAWMRARGTHRSAETETELRRTILRHIADAAEKLIGAEETADCAILFVPSEHVLSELHAHFADVVQESYRARVFMAGPTSLMATLHTISGVLSGGRDHMPANALQEELGDLRRRVAALEARASANGASAPAKPAAPKPAPAAHGPAQYANLFETTPARAPESDDKSPFPLR